MSAMFRLIQRLTSLVDEMGELVSAECQRQGAWALLGEGTGAKLLCPDTGAVLSKDDIFCESDRAVFHRIVQKQRHLLIQMCTAT